MTANTEKPVYVTPGMPDLDNSGPTLSFFEFWPTWLMYLPVVLQWLGLSIWHRSLTLPLLANPKLPLSGMVGVPKSTLFEQSNGECRSAILPWFVYTVTTEPLAQQLDTVMQEITAHNLQLPLVCKPDIGCRGSGVKLIKKPEDLQACIEVYPEGSGLIIQKLASYEPEAGVFYIKHPDEDNGRIVSLALKYTPYVVGDGVSTLLQLIEQDSRASQLVHLYKERHSEVLATVIPKDEPFKLVFSASHCRGAIFRDARELITPELTDSINQIMAGLPEFYYGRMDIKFADMESLAQGKTIEIVEINSASSESLHIWDSKTSIKEAMASLLFQYRTLFTLGSKNRRLGYKTPGVKALLQAWRAEQRLQQFYPETD